MTRLSCETMPPLARQEAEDWLMRQPDIRQAVLGSFEARNRIVVLPDGRLCGRRLAKSAQRQNGYDDAIELAGAPAITVAEAAATIGISERQIRNQIDGVPGLRHSPSKWQIKRGIIIRRE